MAASALNKLGELERAVMDEVWEAHRRGRSTVTVREVHERLQGSRELAYTTVMTVMTRLARKGLLSRLREGRAYHYAPVDSMEQLTASTMHEQLRDIAREDRRTALVHFLDDATDEELEDLHAALAMVEARHHPRPTTD